MALLRIATYNIHKCKGMDGRVRPQRIAEVLDQLKADVIALQEVLGLDDPNGDDQARYLAHQLGYHYTHGETRKHAGLAYGNAVLSRYAVRESCHYDVSVPGREERGCLRVDIELPEEQVIHVFNVHLGTGFRERQKQAYKLLHDELLRSKLLAGPRVVLGDFNEWTRGLTTRMLANEFESADLRLHLNRRRTYPGFFPFLHLDHVYYDGTLRLEKVSVHRTPMALVASDHLPLVAEFAVPGCGSP